MSQKGLSTIGGLLIAFLVAAVAAVSVWTYYTLTTTDITNSEGSDVVINSGNKTADATKDWKTVTNTKYKFTLTLNDAFQNYKWREIPSTSFQTSFIRFYMPTSDTTVNEDSNLGGRYADIFSIVVYTPAQWAEVQKAANESTQNLKANDTKITEDTNYVYAYEINKTLPTDLDSKDFKIPSIIQTFKLTK